MSDKENNYIKTQKTMKRSTVLAVTTYMYSSQVKSSQVKCHLFQDTACLSVNLFQLYFVNLQINKIQLKQINRQCNVTKYQISNVKY